MFKSLDRVMFKSLGKTILTNSEMKPAEQNFPLKFERC